MLELTHAGGVVLRYKDGSPRYLIVTAKSNPSRWIFPKGHIDPGETPEKAAEREVLEEGGVFAKILETIGTTALQKKDGERQHLKFFLMQFVRNGGQGDGRDSQWCTYDEAMKLLSRDYARILLERSHLIAARLDRIEKTAR